MNTQVFGLIFLFTALVTIISSCISICSILKKEKFVQEQENELSKAEREIEKVIKKNRVLLGESYINLDRNKELYKKLGINVSAINAKNTQIANKDKRRKKKNSGDSKTAEINNFIQRLYAQSINNEELEKISSLQEKIEVIRSELEEKESKTTEREANAKKRMLDDIFLKAKKPTC